MCYEPETTGRRRGLCGIVCLSPGRTVLREPGRVCVYCSVQLLFITAVPNTELCAWGEEESGGHVLCVFYYCRTYYKAVRVGGGTLREIEDILIEFARKITADKRKMSGALFSLAREGKEEELAGAIQTSGLPVDTVEPETRLSMLCVAAEVCDRACLMFRKAALRGPPPTSAERRGRLSNDVNTHLRAKFLCASSFCLPRGHCRGARPHMHTHTGRTPRVRRCAAAPTRRCLLRVPCEWRDPAACGSTAR